MSTQHPPVVLAREKSKTSTGAQIAILVNNQEELTKKMDLILGEITHIKIDLARKEEKSSNLESNTDKMVKEILATTQRIIEREDALSKRMDSLDANMMTLKKEQSFWGIPLTKKILVGAFLAILAIGQTLGLVSPDKVDQIKPAIHQTLKQEDLVKDLLTPKKE